MKYRYALEKLIKEGRNGDCIIAPGGFLNDIAKITLQDGALLYTGDSLRYVDKFDYNFHSGKPEITFCLAMAELLVNRKPVRCKSWANQNAHLEPLVSSGGFGYANLELNAITEEDTKSMWEVVDD